MSEVERLTDRDLALLRELIRKEAIALGYGQRYYDYGRNQNNIHEWPSRLKRMRTIIRKLIDNDEL